MDATITATGQQQAEIAVVDNAGAEHAITVTVDGRVPSHETAAYSRDPTERTRTEDEHVRQARRLARYTLADELDQLGALMAEHPRLLDSLVTMIDTLSEEEFEELFGELMQQLESHVSEDVEPVVGLPEEARDEEFLYYTMLLDYDTSGQAGVQEFSQFLDAVGGAVVDNQFANMAGEDSSTGMDFMEDVGQTARDRGYDLTDMLELIEVTTWICTVDAETGNTTVLVGEQLERIPAGAVELPPMEPGTPEQFRRTLQHHLLCQARDSYVGMGLEPANDHFEVQGHGLPKYTQLYRTVDYYEDYHDPNADVSTWDPAELME